jgi:hypothetical protein
MCLCCSVLSYAGIMVFPSFVCNIKYHNTSLRKYQFTILIIIVMLNREFFKIHHSKKYTPKGIISKQSITFTP